MPKGSKVQVRKMPHIRRMVFPDLREPNRRISGSGDNYFGPLPCCPRIRSAGWHFPDFHHLNAIFCLYNSSKFVSLHQLRLPVALSARRVVTLATAATQLESSDPWHWHPTVASPPIARSACHCWSEQSPQVARGLAGSNVHAQTVPVQPVEEPGGAGHRAGGHQRGGDGGVQGGIPAVRQGTLTTRGSDQIKAKY